MIELLRREFEVAAPIDSAWRCLARVEQWPTWARHIKRIDVSPPGEIGPNSTGAIRLSNGIKSTFAMTEFNPPRNWKWAGKFLWLTIHYDHRFESVSPTRTRLIWVVDGEGFGVKAIGRLFSKIYSRNLDRGIPLLVQEISEIPQVRGAIYS